ncbi:amidohydrolase family protein [Marinihelvus fidelis]|uniref:Amidohydrolase family protein n=1 Tax=Marinihelvus fidelis TaxID=2613842 RepID=A0A5N0TCA7_9GAMM|nr:amidohydrolase family protein [Marinihelvus fidelis]KAA9131466.1 amidohydrolase family protein [Marinihelvus fidelis]
MNHLINRRLRVRIQFLAAWGVLAIFTTPAIADVQAITAQRLFEPERGRVTGPVTVLVEDGSITAVNPARIPDGAERIDLGDMTLLPGLLDMHTHITGDYFTGDNWVTTPVMETAPDWAIRGVVFADKTLQAGFTTVRDLGALPGFPDVALMRAVNRGEVPGPDIWPAGHYISITGGHCDVTGFAPGVMELGPKQGVSDGVDEVIKAVRYQAKHGVRVIKVCATAGVYSFSKSAPIGAQQYSEDELRTIVTEATKLGLKVAAHAHGTDGINAAVRAGVASIEHGSILSDESIRLMKERGTYLVPNLYINDMPLPDNTPAEVREKSDYLVPLVVGSLENAYRAGVNMALGTDSGVYPHGVNGREFAALVKNGIEPVDALLMATIHAADLLGVDDRGVIAAGKRADIIAVAGNPLDDIAVMEDVRFVMKEGVVYKR